MLSCSLSLPSPFCDPLSIYPYHIIHYHCPDFELSNAFKCSLSHSLFMYLCVLSLKTSVWPSASCKLSVIVWSLSKPTRLSSGSGSWDKGNGRLMLLNPLSNAFHRGAWHHIEGMFEGKGVTFIQSPTLINTCSYTICEVLFFVLYIVCCPCLISKLHMTIGVVFYSSCSQSLVWRTPRDPWHITRGSVNFLLLQWWKIIIIYNYYS